MSLIAVDANDEFPVFVNATLFAAVAEEAPFGSSVTRLEVSYSSTDILTVLTKDTEYVTAISDQFFFKVCFFAFLLFCFSKGSISLVFKYEANLSFFTLKIMFLG